MVIDHTRNGSDDSIYTEDHISFLLWKNRSLLLKQRYGKGNAISPSSNKHSICIELEDDTKDCSDFIEKKSKIKIPDLVVSDSLTIDEDDSDIYSVVSDKGISFAGEGKYSGNNIYLAVSGSGHLKVKSKNPLLRYKKKIKLSGIFSEAPTSDMLCDGDSENGCGLDADFPIEDALVSPLIDIVARSIISYSSVPSDMMNNAVDDKEGYPLLGVGAKMAKQRKAKDEEEEA